jgi:hypothetical protein
MKQYKVLNEEPSRRPSRTAQILYDLEEIWVAVVVDDQT